MVCASVQTVIIAGQTANGHQEEILQPADRACFMEKLEMLYRGMAQLSERLCSLEKKLEPRKFSHEGSRNVSRYEGQRRQQMDESEDNDENVEDVVERIPLRRRQVATNNLNKLETVRRETEKALKLQLELLMTELREIGRARYQFEEDRARDIIGIVNREKEVQFLLERHRAGRTESRLVPEIKGMARTKESIPKNMKRVDLKHVGISETSEMKVSRMRMVRKTEQMMDSDLQNKNNHTMTEKEIVVPIQEMPGILPAESQEAVRKICVLDRQTGTNPLKVMMAQEMEIQHLKKRCKAAQNKADEGKLKDYNRVDKSLKTARSCRKELKQLHRETLQMYASASEATNNEGGQRQSITEPQRSEFKGTGKEMDVLKLERKIDEVQCGEKLREMGDIPKDGEQKNVPVQTTEVDMDLSGDRTGCLAVAVIKSTEEEKKTKNSVPKMQEKARQTEYQEHEAIIVNKVNMTVAVRHKELDPLMILTGEQKNAVVQVKGGGKNTEDELFGLEAFVLLTETEKVIRKEQAMLVLSQETIKKQREKRDQENLRELEVFQQTGEMKDGIKRVENQNGEKEKKVHSNTEGKMAHCFAFKKKAMETTSRFMPWIKVELLMEEISEESEREVTPMLSKADKNELVTNECGAKEMENDLQSKQAIDLEKHVTGGERQNDKTGSKNEKDNDILLEVKMLLKDMEEEENEREEARLDRTKKSNDKVTKRQSDYTKLVVAQSRCDSINPKGQVRNMGKAQPRWLQARGKERATKDCESPLETEDTLVTSLPMRRKEGRHRASNREGDFDSVWWLEKADTQDQRGRQEQVTAGKEPDDVRELDLERQEQAEQDKEEAINGAEERLRQDVVLRRAQREQERDDGIATFLAAMGARQSEREQKQEERQRKVTEANEIWSSIPQSLHDSCLTETQCTGRRKKNVTFQVKLSNTKWWLQD